MTMLGPIDADQLGELLQVILVDLTLAGDNAVIVGMAARGLEPQERRRAIALGIGIATVLRILMAFGAVWLLQFVGLTLAGGILLLWVAWKMFRELVGNAHAEGEPDPAASGTARSRLSRALVQIVIADVSMSLDNVLAVAGTAHGHVWILVSGLALSVALMGFAASMIAKLLGRFPWITWLGLGVVTFVAGGMIVAGWHEVLPHLGLG